MALKILVTPREPAEAAVEAEEFLPPAVGEAAGVLLVAQFAAGRGADVVQDAAVQGCLLYTSPSPRDRTRSRMPSSA